MVFESIKKFRKHLRDLYTTIQYAKNEKKASRIEIMKAIKVYNLALTHLENGNRALISAKEQLDSYMDLGKDNEASPVKIKNKDR